MADRKKNKFSPKSSDLKRVLRYIIAMSKPEEIEEIASRAHKVSKKHYKRDRQGDPSNWKFYTGKEWLTYGLKEILNIKAGRPINDYRAGMLTMANLLELAGLVGIKNSDMVNIGRSDRWDQIVIKVKQVEDSRMNRLKKLWVWLEERLDVTDIDYLMVHAPGYWQNRESYLDPDWRTRHLTYIFEITYMIQEVVDAKMKVEKWTPVVSGMSKLQLWIVTHEIMGLEEVPHNAVKEVMWQNILKKIEQDNIAKTQ